jgi:cysteine-rich repeat protein
MESFSLRRAASRCALFLVVPVLGLFASIPAFAVISNVDSADDVCAPAADPCNITELIEVVSGSVLDFGLRHVQVTGSGEIDSDIGSFSMRMGQLTVNVSGNAFKIKGALGGGTSLGGTVIVEVDRTCSGNVTIRCFSDLQCSSQGAGDCSVGSGEVSLSGKVSGSADSVGSFILRAGGTITVNADITMSGNSFEADGGFIELQSNEDVIVNAKLETDSGGDGGGGEVCLTAGQDVLVNDVISATGGNFDGGTIEFDAGRDIVVLDDIVADASTGEGYGGSIEMTAVRDIDISGGTGSNKLLLSTQGNSGVCGGETYGGDGGPQDYSAGRDIYLGEFVKIRADGAAPDGYGESISLDAGAHILLEADVDAKSRGAEGGGGELDVFAFGDVVLAATSLVDVSGSDGGGGSVSISPFGDVTINADIDASSSSSGVAGNVDVIISRDFELGGEILVDGGDIMGTGGNVSIAACNINITSNGSVNTKASLATNTLTYRDEMTLASGGSIKATGGGSTTIRYRATPPVLSGTTNPAPVLVSDPSLPACPLCANGVLDPGETCDDGNTISGDGCTTTCVNEGCIAETVGYPSMPLCDDGDGCTLDTCNPVTSGCEHSNSCDDGFACTIDSCMGATCIHTPDDLLCDDSDVCTDEICSAVTGCVFTPNANPCDDGVFCNGDDSCANGTCSVHVGAPCEGLPECQNTCDEIAQGCLAPFLFPCSEDGNPCTDDVCNGSGQCVHLPNSDACDDGIFCNGLDFCSNTSCAVHLGDPCAGGADCLDVCDEGGVQCLAPVGAGCSDDGNVCTDDTCDGAGTCLHTNNLAPCDDGDYCTTSDQCSSGNCIAGDVIPVSARVTIVRKPGVADDRATVKGVYLLSDQMADPSVVGVSIEMRDASSVPFFNATLPASAIVNVGDKGKTFKFRDKEGAIPSASGVTTASFKRNTKKNLVKVKFRTYGYEYSAPVAQPSLSMSLLFGTDPLSAECLTARDIPCVTKVSAAVKVRCRD